MPTIWFNRTFSTHVHTVRGLRAAVEDLHVVASHPNPDSPMLAAADTALPEPIDPDGYVEWALEVAAARTVDVLVVGAHAGLLSAARDRFGSTVLVVPPAASLAVIDDKAAAYAAAAAAGVPVPPYRIATDGAALLAAFDDLRSEGEVCCKPVTGAGGHGFRVIHDDPPAARDLEDVATNRLPVRLAAAALDADPSFGPLLVMPVLPGPEVSVDCLASPDGAPLAAIARTKAGHLRTIVDDPEAVAIAETLVRLHRIAWLSNTQVRYWQRPGVDAAPRPYLLETNGRPAAGSYQTAAAGADLIAAAVRLALGADPGPIRAEPGTVLTVLPTVLDPEPASGT